VFVLIIEAAQREREVRSTNQLGMNIMHNVYQQPELCYYGPASSLSICCALCATTLALLLVRSSCAYYSRARERRARAAHPTKRPPTYRTRSPAATRTECTTQKPLARAWLLLRIKAESNKVSSRCVKYFIQSHAPRSRLTQFEPPGTGAPLRALLPG
jgi:hypothetical protein